MINRKSYKKVKYRKLNKTRKIRGRNRKVSKKKGGGPRGWMGRRVTPKYKQESQRVISGYKTRKEAPRGTSTSKFYTTTSRGLQKQSAKFKHQSHKLGQEKGKLDANKESLNHKMKKDTSQMSDKQKKAHERNIKYLKKKVATKEKRVKEGEKKTLKTSKKVKQLDTTLQKKSTKAALRLSKYGTTKFRTPLARLRKYRPFSKSKNVLLDRQLSKYGKTGSELKEKYDDNLSKVKKLSKELESGKLSEKDRYNKMIELKKSTVELKNDMTKINEVLGKNKFNKKGLKRVHKKQGKTLDKSIHETFKGKVEEGYKSDIKKYGKGEDTNGIYPFIKEGQRKLTGNTIKNQPEIERLKTKTDMMERPLPEIPKEQSKEQSKEQPKKELLNMVTGTGTLTGKEIKGLQKFNEAQNKLENRLNKKPKQLKADFSVTRKNAEGRVWKQEPGAPGGEIEIKSGDPEHPETPKTPKNNIKMGVHTTRKRKVLLPFIRKKTN